MSLIYKCSERYEIFSVNDKKSLETFTLVIHLLLIDFFLPTKKEHKTSWAKMALASKEQMERLAAELKEKEEQEKIKKQRLSTRPQLKFHG